MNVVAGEQDELPALVVVIVFDRPDRQFSINLLPVDAVQTTRASCLHSIQHAFGYGRRSLKLFKVLRCAAMIRNQFFVLNAAFFTPHAHQVLDKARIVLELFVKEALDPKGKPNLFALDVEHLA